MAVTSWNRRAKEAQEHAKEHWQGTSWIAEMIASGTRDSKTFKAFRFILKRLRTTRKPLLQLVRGHWSVGSWHWIRDTELHEGKHRYRGNSGGMVVVLRTDALNWFR
jgi:hypothetical protein